MAGTMTQTAEVVIVGAGIMGVSTAYHLARLGAGRVIVLERDTVCSGSTALGSGGIRHQYANRLYGYKLAPPPAEIMSIGGFSSRRSSVSYVIAGSFSKWLIERYGMKRYLSAFAWGETRS